MHSSRRAKFSAAVCASLMLMAGLSARAETSATYKPQAAPPAPYQGAQADQGCGYDQPPRYRNRVNRYADPYRYRNYDRGYYRSYRPYPYRGYRRPYKRNRWNMPWSNGKRGGFFGGDGFRDRMSDGWDDMINAPSKGGKMPGGWYFPTMDVPNPVDVTDEFERNFRDMPDNFNSNN